MSTLQQYNTQQQQHDSASSMAAAVAAAASDAAATLLTSSSSSSSSSFAPTTNTQAATQQQQEAAATAFTTSAFTNQQQQFGTLVYDALPKQLQFYLFDFWEMFPNKELNKYTLFNGGPWLTVALILSYLYFVLRFGPRFMQNRKPFDLKPLIRLYNFAMVIFNAYLFYHASPFLNFGLWGWGCGKAVQPMVAEAVPVVYLVLISRFCDFFDTVFFVLRKKFTHVSFLHVFHHSIVPLGFWIGVKFAFFPVCCFVPYLNLVVHVIMYSYYGLSTFGPRVQKYLWWKKYLTRLQIAQFLIALVHSLQPLYLTQCSFPFIFVYGQTAGAMLFLWLFVSFYVKAYSTRRNQEASRRNSVVSSSAAATTLTSATSEKITQELNEKLLAQKLD